MLAEILLLFGSKRSLILSALPRCGSLSPIAQQGLAARLWSVTLGCAVLYGSVPDLDPGLLHWDPDAGAPDDLWLAEVRPLPADAATVADVVLKGHLEPLAAALRARHRVAPGLLRGNAASALAGAARQLDHWAAAHGHPRAAAHTRSLAAGLLAHPLLVRHRNPHRHLVPPPQLLPLLPGARRRPVR